MLADGSCVPCFLLANKCDTIENREDFEKKRPLFDKFVEEKGFSGWFETSAKDNVNINQAATKLIERVIENEGRLAPPRDRLINYYVILVASHNLNLRLKLYPQLFL